MTSSAENTVLVEPDFLETDADIRGQKYACISFISPEDVLPDKDAFMFAEFVTQFGADVSTLFDNLQEKFTDDTNVQEMLMLLRQQYAHVFQSDAMDEKYKSFKQANLNKLEADFHEKNDFRTTVRGFKIRGSYASVAEAQNRSLQIAKTDPKFNVYIAEIGCWCPWNPAPDAVTESVYMNNELNTLMKKYKEELDKKDEFYLQRKDANIAKVKMHAEKNKDEAGGSGVTVITEEGQTVVEEGDKALIQTTSDISDNSYIQDLQPALEGDDLWMQRKAQDRHAGQDQV